MKDTVSLEIAKQLKEAGWEQESRLPEYVLGGNEWHFCLGEVGSHDNCRWDEDGGYLMAVTIGELLEACGLVELKKLNNGNYRVWNYKNDNEPGGQGVENPADALGLLWIALKEKGIV